MRHLPPALHQSRDQSSQSQVFSPLKNPTFPFITSRHTKVSRPEEDVCKDFKEPREEKRRALIRLNQ